jgi:transcription elongation GreA/GreB family factor
MPTGGISMQTKITSSMRASLEARLDNLDSRIDALRRENDGDDSVDATALLYELSRESDQICSALGQAKVIDDDPFDTHATEIGDTVTIRDSEGVTEQYVLVDGGVGTRVRLNWVSARSPLGGALVGRRKGEEILVKTPVGGVSYVIVDFERAGDVGGGPFPAPELDAF